MKNPIMATSLFIDIDGFLNTTRFPLVTGDPLEWYSFTIVSETPVCILSISKNFVQISEFSAQGFGPREDFHAFMFEEIFHNHAKTIPAGNYKVGKNINSGLYTLSVSDNTNTTLIIQPEGMENTIQYALEGPASYTFYLPEAAIVGFTQGSLTSVTHDTIFIPGDDNAISGTMRLLGGQQIVQNRKDAYIITPVDECDIGYYRYATFLTDTGDTLQREFELIEKGTEKQVYLRPGEFIEFIDCTLEKMISNG